MPVRRFRDVADLPEPPRAGSALDGLRAACEASEVAAALGVTRVGPRGVRRFRSVEEADEYRRGWPLSAAE